MFYLFVQHSLQKSTTTAVEQERRCTFKVIGKCFVWMLLLSLMKSSKQIWNHFWFDLDLTIPFRGGLSFSQVDNSTAKYPVHLQLAHRHVLVHKRKLETLFCYLWVTECSIHGGPQFNHRLSVWKNMSRPSTSSKWKMVRATKYINTATSRGTQLLCGLKE